MALDTTPYWLATTTFPEFSSLSEDVVVDVVVIGGGITGITAAHLIKAAGLRVALIDRGHIAQVDTGHTTAHLTYVTDLRLTELARTFGKDRAQAVWDGGRYAIEQIAATIESERIDCNFHWVPGYLHAPLGSDGPPEGGHYSGSKRHTQDTAVKDDFASEAELASSLGFTVAFEPRVPLVNRPGIRFEKQALFHPGTYLSALVQGIPGDGSYVFERSAADSIVESPLRVCSGDHFIICEYVVVATHNPLVGKASFLSSSLLQTKLALYTSYAVGGSLPAGTQPAASFWDTADPYYYLRIDRHNGHDYAILGGLDHKTGQETDTAARYAALEQRLRALFPGIDVTHRWSGQVIETNDGLPYIGEAAPRQFVATGFAGNGMTFGTLAAMMARDAALGRRNPWCELFDVNRTKLRGGAWDYVRENKDYAYYLVRDRVTVPEGQSLDALRPGDGKIFQLDGKPVAASRDEHGFLTLRSAVCTHMGCLVNWNNAEHTWDCPCHGSRFKADGCVLSGPAERDLDVFTSSTDAGTSSATEARASSASADFQRTP